jgi:hypothetical protein
MMQKISIIIELGVKTLELKFPQATDSPQLTVCFRWFFVYLTSLSRKWTRYVPLKRRDFSGRNKAKPNRKYERLKFGGGEVYDRSSD